jgi:hypothetical protein
MGCWGIQRYWLLRTRPENVRRLGRALGLRLPWNIGLDKMVDRVFAELTRLGCAGGDW